MQVYVEIRQFLSDIFRLYKIQWLKVRSLEKVLKLGKQYSLIVTAEHIPALAAF